MAMANKAYDVIPPMVRAVHVRIYTVQRLAGHVAYGAGPERGRRPAWEVQLTDAVETLNVNLSCSIHDAPT